MADGGVAEEHAPTRAELRRSQHRARRNRRIKVAAVVLGFVVLVVVGAGIGYVEYLNHEIGRVNVKHLQATATTGAEAQAENILLVGSTSRCALTTQNPAFGLCSEGVTGVNSDVVMILHVDPNHHRLAILSLPRDLFVPNARTTGANKIDAALFQGPDQLVSVIEQDFAIPIQHYVELNFDSFQGVVNALGGVKMYFPMPLFDLESSLYIPNTGCQTLNGFQALAVVRARHLQYKPPNVTTTDRYYWPQDPESDLSRIRRDHEFIRVLAAAVQKKGLGNPITDQQLVAAVAPQLQVDSGLGLGQMVSLVLTFHSVNPGSAPQYTIPVQVHGGLDFYYQGYDYGSIEFPSQPEDRQTIDRFLGVQANVDTMTGRSLPLPQDVPLAVIGGTGVYSDATKAASALEAQGFDVVSTSSSYARSTPAETMVEYANGSTSGQAAAQEVASALTGPAVLDAVSPSSLPTGSKVALLVGTGMGVTAPAGVTPTTTTTTVGSGSYGTTTTTTAPSSGALSTPTSATESLAAFDPRSCTASGGEGP